MNAYFYSHAPVPSHSTRSARTRTTSATRLTPPARPLDPTTSVLQGVKPSPALARGRHGVVTTTTTTNTTTTPAPTPSLPAAAASATPVRTVAAASYAGGHTRQGGSQRPLSSGAAGTTPGSASPTDHPGNDPSPALPPPTHRGGSATPAVPCLVLFSPQGVRPLDGLTTTSMLTAHTAALQHRSDGLNRLDRTGGAGKTTAAVGGSGYSGRGVARVPEGVRCVYDRDTRSQLLHIAAGTEVDFSAFMRLPGQARGVGGMGGGGGLAGAPPPGSSAAPAAATAVGGPHTVLAVQLCVAAPVPTAGELHGDAARRQAAHVPSLTPPPGSVHVELVIRAGPANAAPSAGGLSGGSSGYRLRFTNAVHAVQRHAHHIRFPLQCVRTAQWMQLYIDVESVMRACQAHGAAVGTTSSSSPASANTVYRVLQLRIGTAATRTAAGQAASGGVYVRRVVAGYGLPMPPADVDHLHLAAGQHSATDSEGRLWMLPEPLRLPVEAGECTTVFVRTGEETVLRTAPMVVAAETEEEAASTPVLSPAGSRAASETARVAASAVDTTRQGPSTALPSHATPPPLFVEDAEAAGRQRRSSHRVSPAPLPRRVRERHGSDAASASTPTQDTSVTPQRRAPPHSTALEALRRRQGVREGKESGGVREAYSAAAGAAQAFAATPLPESPVLSAQRSPSLPSSSTSPSSSSSTEAEVFVVREVATMQQHARESPSRFAEEQRAVEPAAVPQQSTTVQEREGEESAEWRDDDQPWVVPDSGMHHEEAAVRRGGGATDMMPPRAEELKVYSDNDTKRDRSRVGATQALPRADDGAAPDCRTAAEYNGSTTAAANAACDASSPPSAFARTRAQPRPTSRPSTSTPARGGARPHGGKDMGADREVEAPYRDVQKDASLWATSIVSEPSSAISCTPSPSASSLSSSLLSTSAVAELMEEMSARVRRIHAVLAENQSMKNEEKEEVGEEAKRRTAAAGAAAAVKAAASLTQRRVALPPSSRPTAGTDLPAQSPPPLPPASPRADVTAEDHTGAQPALPLPLAGSRQGDLADLLAKRTVLSRLPPAAPGAATPLSLLPARARTTSAVTAAAAAASGPAQEAVTTAAKHVQETDGEVRESESTRTARGDVGVKEGGGDVLDAQAVLELWSSTEVPLQLPSFTSQPSSLPPRQHHADADGYHPPWEHRSSNTRGDGEAAEKRPLEARPAVPPAPSEDAANTGGAAAPPWSDSAVTSWTFQSSTAANTATTAVNSAAPVASPSGALPRDEAGQSHRLPPSRQQQQHVAPQEHLKELPQSVSTFQLSSKAVVWRRPAPAAAVALRHPASAAVHKAASDDVRMGEETPLTVRVRAADTLSAAATGGYPAQQHRAPISDGMSATDVAPRDPSERGEGVLRTPGRGVVTRHSDVVAAVRHDSRAPSAAVAPAAAGAAPSSHYTASSVGSFHMWLPHPMPPLAPGAARYPSLTTTATTTTTTTTTTDTALRIVGREGGGGGSRGDAEGRGDGPGGRPPVVRLSAATPTRSPLPSLTEGTPQAEAVMGAATTLTDAAVGEGDGAAVSDRSRPSVRQQAQAQQPGPAWPGQQAKAPLPLAPASAPTNEGIQKPGVSSLPAAGAGVVKQVRGAISGGGAEANRYMYDAVLQCFLDLETNAYVELAV